MKNDSTEPLPYLGQRQRLQRFIRQGEWFQRNRSVLSLINGRLLDAFGTLCEAESDKERLEVLDGLMDVLDAATDVLGELSFSNDHWTDGSRVNETGEVSLYNRFGCSEHRYEVVLPALSSMMDTATEPDQPSEAE